MPKLVEDEFTDLSISRQRRYQLRKQLKGLCTICAQPSAPNHSLCSRHRVIQSLRYKRRREEVPGSRSARLGLTGTAFDLRPGCEFV